MQFIHLRAAIQVQQTVDVRNGLAGAASEFRVAEAGVAQGNVERGLGLLKGGQTDEPKIATW